MKSWHMVWGTHFPWEPIWLSMLRHEGGSLQGGESPEGEGWLEGGHLQDVRGDEVKAADLHVAKQIQAGKYRQGCRGYAPGRYDLQLQQASKMS